MAKVHAPVVVVLATEHVDVECYSRSNRERVENVRQHLSGEVPDLFALEFQIRHAVRT